MSFDDELRNSLDAAGRTHRDASAPTEELVANVGQRRRKRLALAGAAGAAAIALVVGVAVALPGDSATPQARLDAAGRPTDATDDAGGGPPAGSVSDDTTTTTPAATSPPHAASGSTIPPSGTGYSPPGSVMYPSATTTAPQPTTTSPPATGETVSVTQDDNGKTFTLRPGQHLVVTLNESGYIWSEPDTDNSAVLTRTAVSANPSSDRVTASFDAKKSGQAHVSASKDLPCRNASPPCMAPTQLWQITVNVA